MPTTSHEYQAGVSNSLEAAICAAANEIGLDAVTNVIKEWVFDNDNDELRQDLIKKLEETEA